MSEEKVMDKVVKATEEVGDSNEEVLSKKAKEVVAETLEKVNKLAPNTGKEQESALSPVLKKAKALVDSGKSVAHQIENGVKNLIPVSQSEFEWPDWVAPIDIPITRRRQTLAVLIFMGLQLTSVAITIYCFFSPWTWFFFVPYLIFMFFDVEAPKDGIGRRSSLVRNFPTWKWFADYFPVTLHKTKDLDPSRKYLFAYHPHGIIGIGAITAFGTNACGVDEMFPGVTIHPMTLKTNFRFPFYRELLLWCGLADVGKTSITNTIGEKSPPGSSCLIVVGGAAEALDAIPNTMDLTIKRRKGFVKMAIQNGASLVPVLGFGENDLWNQVENPRGSKLRERQNMLMRTLGFSTPLLFGRGVFQYKYGILPLRSPIHVVVGQPIEVKKNENPSIEELDAYHQTYLNELQSLYDNYKDKFHANRIKDLSFVE